MLAARCQEDRSWLVGIHFRYANPSAMPDLDVGLALEVVPSESVEGDDYVMPGVCFAGQPTVSVEPAEIGGIYRSHRRSGTAVIALRVQLWKSSDPEAGITTTALPPERERSCLHPGDPSVSARLESDCRSVAKRNCRRIGSWK